MYYEESEDLACNYFDNFTGEIYRLLEIKSLNDISKYVLITTEPTINVDYVKVSLYWQNKKVFSARYSNDNWCIFRMNDLFNWFYMDKVDDFIRERNLINLNNGGEIAN